MSKMVTITSAPTSIILTPGLVGVGRGVGVDFITVAVVAVAGILKFSLSVICWLLAKDFL